MHTYMCTPLPSFQADLVQGCVGDFFESKQYYENPFRDKCDFYSATLYFGTCLRCFRRGLGVNLEVQRFDPPGILKNRIARLAMGDAWEAAGCR
jgi:hypothetical protein